MGSENSFTGQQSSLYLNQISASNEFVQNLLQKFAVETRFW